STTSSAWRSPNRPGARRSGCSIASSASTSGSSCAVAASWSACSERFLDTVWPAGDTPLPVAADPAPRAGADVRMEDVVSLCARRGIVFQSSEIYGGINGFWDYGPLGVELKNNLRDAWWDGMVHHPPAGPGGR